LRRLAATTSEAMRRFPFRPLPPVMGTARPKDGPNTGERNTEAGPDWEATPPLHPLDQGTSR